MARTKAPVCRAPGCGKPIDALKGERFARGAICMHALCARKAHEAAYAKALPSDEEPTFRVVGVRRDGSREIVSNALGYERATHWAKTSGRNRADNAQYVRYVIEQE